MKKVAVVICFLALLTGCASENKELERGMQLRDRLLSATGCSFDAEITADYGNTLYTFALRCQADAQGNVDFTVLQPETIAGITGTISDTGGKLTFDDVALPFELMADDQVTPVSAPWIFLKTLRSGYLTSVGREGDLLRLSMDDSYKEDALHLDIWLDGEDIPLRAEICYDDRRILSLAVKNFEIL